MQILPRPEIRVSRAWPTSDSGPCMARPKIFLAKSKVLEKHLVLQSCYKTGGRKQSPASLAGKTEDETLCLFHAQKDEQWDKWPAVALLSPETLATRQVKWLVPAQASSCETNKSEQWSLACLTQGNSESTSMATVGIRC